MPLDAILFGGRRATNVPLVVEATDWTHGVFMGANDLVRAHGRGRGHSRRTAPRPVRDAPLLRLQHGRLLGSLVVQVGQKLRFDRAPRVYQVNWFRKDDDGSFLWPGFGDNSRVLEWIVRRLEGQVPARESPIGRIPAEGDLNVDGTDVTEVALAKLFAVDRASWLAEADLTDEFFGQFGSKVPPALRAELASLRYRLRTS